MSVSRRNLRSIARNIGHKFAYSADYILQLAHINAIKVIRADILNLKFEIDLFNIERNINLLECCKSNLLYNMEAYKPFYLCSANLIVTLGNYACYIERGRQYYSTDSFEIELIDNEKRIWKGRYLE